MSSTMMWRPVRPKEGASVAFEVKKALSPHFFHHDGSLGGGPIQIGPEDLGFLRGVLAGFGGAKGAKDIERMIAAVERHGAIEVWFET